MCLNSNDELPINRQAELLNVSRKCVYRKNIIGTISPLLLNALDELYTHSPYFGQRRLCVVLFRDYGIKAGRWMIRKAMSILWIEVMYPKKNTSMPNIANTIYPYLLANLKIERPNQVWGSDITYIRLEHWFIYLVAIIDWYSRKVLAWRLSTTMDTYFCTECLNEAIERYGKPEVSNTDQWSQFTSKEFTDILKKNGIQISMDGKRRWVDNVFTERLWRSLKQNEVYHNAYQSPAEALRWISTYFHKYNTYDPHQSLWYATPDSFYFPGEYVQKVLLSPLNHLSQRIQIKSTSSEYFSKLKSLPRNCLNPT